MWWYLDICVDIWIVYIIQTPTFNSLCKRSKTPRRDIILWWACRRILLTTACSWNGCPGRQSCVPHFVIQWSWSILGYRTGRLWSARFTTPVLLKHNIHPVHKITHRSHSSVHWGTAARFRTQSVECSCACRHALAGLVTLNWLGVSACLSLPVHSFAHQREQSHGMCWCSRRSWKHKNIWCTSCDVCQKTDRDRPRIWGLISYEFCAGLCEFNVLSVTFNWRVVLINRAGAYYVMRLATLDIGHGSTWRKQITFWHAQVALHGCSLHI